MGWDWMLGWNRVGLGCYWEGALGAVPGGCKEAQLVHTGSNWFLLVCRTLAEYMSEKVTHVVTAQEWDETFEEALELNPALAFVRPRWVLLCGERLRPLPAQPFAVVPRA